MNLLYKHIFVYLFEHWLYSYRSVDSSYALCIFVPQSFPLSFLAGLSHWCVLVPGGTILFCHFIIMFYFLSFPCITGCCCQLLLLHACDHNLVVENHSSLQNCHSVEFVELTLSSGLYFVQCLWKLVPRLQAIDSAGNGQDNESKSCIVCVAGTNQKGTAALLFRTDGAVPLISELWRAVLKSDHLVSWKEVDGWHMHMS